MGPSSPQILSFTPLPHALESSESPAKHRSPDSDHGRSQIVVATGSQTDLSVIFKIMGRFEGLSSEGF